MKRIFSTFCFVLLAFVFIVNPAEAQETRSRILSFLTGVGLSPEVADYISKISTGTAVYSNAAWEQWRNAANSANLNVLRANSSNNTELNSGGSSIDFQVGGTVVYGVTSAGLVSVANPFQVISNTSDGSDNKIIKINGGGGLGSTRGAELELDGNENAQTGGVVLSTGAVTSALMNFSNLSTSGDILFSTTGSNLARWRILSAGTLASDATNGGNIVLNHASAAINFAGTTPSIGTTAANSIALKTNSLNRWAIDTSGNLSSDGTNGGDLVVSKAGNQIKLTKGGAAATSGQFTCNGVTGVVVSTTAASANMVVSYAPSTISGTAAVGGPYISAISSGVSFTVKCSVAGETSVYNWAMTTLQ